MKFCQIHWDELRAKLTDRGLDKFIASSGEEAATRVQSGGFEPLMGAHNAIVHNCLRIGGIGLLGDGCPLCTLIDGCQCALEPCPYTTFTTRAADEALDEAKKLGLMGET